MKEVIIKVNGNLVVSNVLGFDVTKDGIKAYQDELTVVKGRSVIDVLTCNTNMEINGDVHTTCIVIPPDRSVRICATGEIALMCAQL